MGLSRRSLHADVPFERLALVAGLGHVHCLLCCLLGFDLVRYFVADSDEGDQ